MKDLLSASSYRENTIKIPHSRLAKIIQPDDSIYGFCKRYPVSADYVEYRVTHVSWWGVYAVPTAKMIKGLGTRYVKGHVKFKWFNITGVVLKG